MIPLRWLLCAIVGGAVATLRSAEQSELKPAQAELAKKFAGVTQWQGIWDVSVIGAASISSVGGHHLESRYEARARGTFTLEHGTDGAWEPERGVFTWQGKGEASGGGQGTFSESFQGRYGEDWSQEFSGTVEQERIEFSLWLDKRSASLHPGLQRENRVPSMRRTGQSFSDGGNKVQPIDTNFKAPIDTWYLGSGDADSARRWQVVSRGPAVFVFKHESPSSGRSQKFLTSGAGVIQRSRVILFPVYEDLEVEVTIADYAKWRPLGSIADPKKPGNSLVARAVLKAKGGKPKQFPAVKAFRFELMDTSREPGVCLNWPLGAKDEDYDLRLANESGGTLSDAGQKLLVSDSLTDDKGQPYAEAKIDSYDFGGRATLQVVCELGDGRELIGLMRDESGEQDLVRLPKMNGPDWIADVWRKEKKVEKLAANHDDEKVENQKHHGDGFTLYEEYRGWAVNGKHLEGDPEKKDFFVLNLIGADGQNGVDLFERLSKLRVHSKLKRSEMSQTARLMNGNHRDAPQRVPQHGVWVKTFTREKLGDNGADTPMTKAGVAGRPGITKGVGILARADEESIFNKPFNLPARDTIFAYDRAIAHELLHSVGVEHHGPADTTRYALKFIPPNVPENKIGRPHYQSGDGTVFTVRLENGHDLAAETHVHYAETMAKFGPTMLDMLINLWSSGPAGSSDPKVARERAEASLRGALDTIYAQRGLVGMAHAEHSGDQDCVMRYYFAKFYEATGDKTTLYLVTPGTERIGIDICHAGVGTGINAPGHKPQSRYGNAAAGEGECFSQICPNDAIPPRKTKK